MLKCKWLKNFIAVDHLFEINSDWTIINNQLLAELKTEDKKNTLTNGHF